jgi:molecular chaperone DnaK
VPQIEVSFDIDANGILSVSARDKATGKEQSIKIQASSGLSEDEIKSMVKDAEAHAGEDKARRESVEVRNRADSLVYQVEKQVAENGDKLDAATKAKVEGGIERVKKALEGSDAAEIKSATDDLEQLFHGAAQEMYQASAAEGEGEGGPGAGDGTGTPDGEGDGTSKKGSVDADFEVVED